MQSLEMSRPAASVVVALGAFAGAVAFFAAFPRHILNPLDLDWLMSSADPATHLIGWLYFNSEPWHWPIGLITDYGAPVGTTIAFTDSVPLLALPLKVLSTLLPREFQYFGWWLLACFVLQGVFAALLMRRIGLSAAASVLAALILASMPLLYMRGAGHYALAAHWLLLAALWLYFSDTRSTRLAWVALASTALLVHPYLFVMVTALLTASVIKARWIDGVPAPLLLGQIVVPVGVCAFVLLYLLGYLSIPARNFANGTYGDYSANLNTWIEPAGWSSAVRPRPTLMNGQYEGFAFPGIGPLLASAIAIFELIRKPPSRTAVKAVLPLAVVCAVLCVIAAAPQFAWDDRPLFPVTLPHTLMVIAGILKATGRFVWPAAYAVAALSIGLLARRLGRRKAVICLGVLASIHLIDMRGPLMEYPQRFAEAQSRLISPFWSAAAPRYRELALVCEKACEYVFPTLGRYAFASGMTFSHGYGARQDENAVATARQRRLDELCHGNVDPKTLYVAGSPESVACVNKLTNRADLLALIDGFVVLAPGGKDLIQPGPPVGAIIGR